MGLIGHLHRQAMKRLDELAESFRVHVREAGARTERLARLETQLETYLSNGGRERHESLKDRVVALEHEIDEKIRPAMHDIRNMIAEMKATQELRRRGIEP